MSSPYHVKKIRRFSKVWPTPTPMTMTTRCDNNSPFLTTVRRAKNYLSLTFHHPIFPGIFAQRPEIQIFIHIQVHTITLNTVTKYKVYPYIQTSLNQIVGIFNNLKTLENDQVSLFINPFSLGNLPQDPRFKYFIISSSGPHYHAKHCDKV